jgi:hypothetical protein
VRNYRLRRHLSAYGPRGLVGVALRRQASNPPISKHGPHVWARVDHLAWEAVKLKTKEASRLVLTYSTSRAAPGRRGGATAIPCPMFHSKRKGSEVSREERRLEFTWVWDAVSTRWIIELLQNRDNGGHCPFMWQEFMVFEREYMAGSCQRLKSFALSGLTNDSAWEKRVHPAVLLGDLCQTMPKRVNDEFEPVGDFQF